LSEPIRPYPTAVDILGTKPADQVFFQQYSCNKLRFLNRRRRQRCGQKDDTNFFVQQGRKVFKDVCPMVAELSVSI